MTGEISGRLDVVARFTAAEFSDVGDVDPQQLAVTLDRILQPAGLRVMGSYGSDHAYHIVSPVGGEGRTPTHTDDEVLQSEEEEIEKLVDRMDLDEQLSADPAPEIFMYVYGRRTGEVGVTAGDVSDYFGISEGTARNLLEGLAAMELVESEDETFYWPY